MQSPKYPFVRPIIPRQSEWAPFLTDCYDKRYFTNFGPAEQRFTEELKAEFGKEGESCIVCSSATAGLTAALIAAGARGKVVVPSFTFPATLHAIYAARCEPVLCDVESDSWEASARTIREAAKTAGQLGAFVVVRPMGLTRELDEIAALARSLEIPLIIDAAAALGIPRRDSPPYPCDYVEVFSLHATKSFGIGEGGAIFAPKVMHEKLRSALNFGLLPDRTFGYGVNGKMSEFQAAVGLATLEIYKGLIRARQEMAKHYIDFFSGRNAVTWAPDILASPCSTFPILLQEGLDAQRFSDRALAFGVQLRRYYHPSLSQGFREAGSLGATETSNDLATRMVCCPVYADASRDEIREILVAIEGSLSLTEEV